MKNKLEQACVETLLFIIQKIPELWTAKLGRGFGMLVYALGVRKGVTQTNLNIAFGEDLSSEQQSDLCKKTYQNLGNTFFEVFLMKFIPVSLLSNYVEIEGLQVLEEAMKEEKGVMLTSGHFGHWELMTAAISSFSTPVSIYSGQQRNPFFDSLLNEVRQKFGTHTIPKSKTSFIEMSRVLKKKQLFGILGDLNESKHPHFISFFGKAAASGVGIPTFILKFKCPLLFAWTVRTGPLQHKVQIIRLNYELSGDRTEDLKQVSQLVSDQLESVIKQHPEHYFWLNKRWKTRPSDENEPALY